MPAKKELPTAGELRRIGRNLRRSSKREEVAYLKEKVEGRGDANYTHLMHGRSIGLAWAAREIEQRVRELTRKTK